MQIDFKVGGTDRVVISTQSIKVPTGSTGDRDGTPATGMFRFNTTTSGFEGYNGTEWVLLAVAVAQIGKQ